MDEAIVISCPACTLSAKVPLSAIGLLVECPHCLRQYRAEPAPAEPDIPTVQPRVRLPQPAPIPVVFPHPKSTRPHESSPLPDATDTSSFLFAMALLPLGIPLMWLVFTLLAAPSAFSFAAPVAVAVGVTVMALGLAAVSRWSVAIRAWSMLFLHGLAYASCVLLYVAPAEWLEVVREIAVFRSGISWREYAPGNQAFKVRVPNSPAEELDYLPGWKLTGMSFLHKGKLDRFVVAHGEGPNDIANLEDEAFFAAVQARILTQHGGECIKDQPVPIGEGRVHEYQIELPDHTTRRVVRVLRFGRSLCILSVEGPFLFADRTDLKHFFNSFKWKPKK